MKRLLLGALVTATALASTQVRAQSVADFYKGNTIQIVVGHQPGTGFDLYARTLARHMGKHVPGNPSIVVQNMNGASGLTAFNWLSNVAPKDGTAIVTAVFTAPFEPLYGNKSARFNAAKLNWIGNMDSSVSVCGVSKESGIKSFDEILKRETVAGGTGHSGPLSQSPRALNHLVGAKFKVIEGYKGSASVKLAMQRSEIQAVCGISLSTVRTQYRDVTDAGDFKLVLQIGPEPHPDLKDVPHVYSFAKTDEDRAVFDMIFGTQGLGRSFVAPTGVPQDRVKALRAAFNATLDDPKFQAEAKQANLDLRPQSGDAVQAFVEKIYAAPKAVVDRARTALGR